MRHDVEVIMVGDELLKGERRDAHLEYIGQQLRACGLRVARAHVCGDVVETIAAQLRDCAERARVVILSGGLGPTDDDITREGVAAALGVDLEFHSPTWQRITEFFKSRGRQPSDANRRQAHFPAGANVYENPLGTAPGFGVQQKDLDVFVLPGPPVELRPMLENNVVPRLREIFPREPLRVETFRTIGIGESQLVGILGEHLHSTDAYAVSSLPSMVGVDIIYTQLESASSKAVKVAGDKMDAFLRETIGTKYYGRGTESLAEVVHGLLVTRGETLAIAESLTGGWIGKKLTDIPGSSAYLLADVVTYSDDSKVKFVGVRPDTLEKFGAVSEEVCREMAHGVRSAVGATYGMATTGIAGPSGGTPKKPVGLTFVATAFEGGSNVKRLSYKANRDIVRQRAAQFALHLLYDYLAKHE